MPALDTKILRPMECYVARRTVQTRTAARHILPSRVRLTSFLLFPRPSSAISMHHTPLISSTTPNQHKHRACRHVPARSQSDSRNSRRLSNRASSVVGFCPISSFGFHWLTFISCRSSSTATPQDSPSPSPETHTHTVAPQHVSAQQAKRRQRASKV
jgi:hypothetical protein